MKSLKILQTLFKIFRIIALVLFILAIVGASLTFLALVLLFALRDVLLAGGQTITDILASNGIPFHVAYSALIVAFLNCGVTIFLAKYNEIFFKFEVDKGTPFDKEVVHKMRVLALVSVITSFAFAIIVAITLGIIAFVNRVSVNIDFSSFGGVGYGLALLLISFFCAYGAELEEQNKKAKENSDEYLENEQA